MAGIMSNQLKKLTKKASQWAWPVIATVLVGTGGALGYGAVQAGEEQNPVGVGASLAGLVGVAVGAGYAKRENQSRRDKELGISDESGYPTINAGNFVAATGRNKFLGRKPPIMLGVGACLITGKEFVNTALEFVSVGASFLALAGVVALTTYAKPKTNLYQDENLGIVDEGNNLTMDERKFVVAKKRYEDLGMQEKIMVGVGVGLVLLGATVLPAAVGCGIVIGTMGVTAGSREKNLKEELTDAAWDIVLRPRSNPANVLKEARSFLTNLRQL